MTETMRKYPPVPILNRICTKDTILPPNIKVSKGTAIVIPVFGLHRDPMIYPDPDKFDPDRFNATEIAARHPYAFLPFGEGPRICIGLFRFILCVSIIVKIMRELFYFDDYYKRETTTIINIAISFAAAKLGYLQTKIGIVNILSKYKFKLAPQTAVPLTFTSAPIILRVKDKINVIIEPR